MKKIEYNEKRSEDIQTLIESSHYRCSELSLAIIDLTKEIPEIFGSNLDQFIYPASCYKVFVGAEVLRQIDWGTFDLLSEVEVKSPNDVDQDTRIFPDDTRPLLKAGDTVTVDYLLDLMLTRSDNSASNCLIDLVGRESITERIIHRYGWDGSEVTRKFLDRSKESKQYAVSERTLSCARHLAEFFYRVETGNLVSEFVSNKLKEYMSRFKRNRPGLFLSYYESFYRKGGWLEGNLWEKDIDLAQKTLQEKGWAVIRWHNDAGVVKTPHAHYAIAMMSLTKTGSPNDYFNTTDLARKVLSYMENN